MDDRIEMDDNHVYWVDGVPYPSVTTIIEDIMPRGFEFPPEAAIRGQRVHSACHYFDEGDLDFESLDPLLIPYVDAWQQFKTDTGISIEAIEKPFANKMFGYAGRIDRIVKMPKWGKILQVIDIKSGIEDERRERLQTMGYALGLYGYYGRGCVYLQDNGKYHFKRHEDDARDKAVFLSFVTAFKYKYEGGTEWTTKQKS